MSEFRRFNPEFLKKRLDEKDGVVLLPPGETVESLAEASSQDLSENFPHRYATYLNLLRREGSEGLTPSEKVWFHAMNSLGIYLEKERTTDTPTLYEHQMGVFDDIQNELEHGEKDGYITMPTGTGKTIIFTKLVEALNLPTLIVVPTKELVTQTQDKFAKFAQNTSVGVHYSRRKDVDRPVTVTTYASFIQGVKDGTFLPSDYGLLILDEVQAALAEQASAAVKAFDAAIRIGFSATPEYSEEKSAKNLLGKEWHRIELVESIREGILSGVSVIYAQTNIDLSQVQILDGKNYNKAELERAINEPALTRACVELYQQAFTGEQAIAFCAGVEHAKDLAQAFRDAGIKAEAIHGDMPDSERERIIKECRSGNIKVLTNYAVLDTGLDVPEISVCFNLEPTASLVRATQRPGRVLRPDETRPEKIATVVEFIHQDARKHNWILYPSILEGETELTKRTGSPTIRAELERMATVRKKINITGLRIAISHDEIMRITRENSDIRERSKKLPWEQFVEAVRAAGIQGWDHYKKVQKDHQEWPAAPERFLSYKNHWTSWHELCGKEKKVPWEQFVTEVRAAGIEGKKHYEKVQKDHQGWPSNPDTFGPYKNSWSSWPELFGKEKEVPKIPWEKFVEAVRATGIRGRDDYYKIRKDHQEWPSNPDTFGPYKNSWSSWPELFGKERKNKAPKIPWEKFVEAVRAKGITGSRHYKEVQKDHQEWPTEPHKFKPYKNHWSSWQDLCGKE